MDLENLIEELESMGRSDRRALTSLLTRLWKHLLKLTYWQSEREYNRRGWESEILNFRVQIRNLLEESPSLKHHLERVFEQAYRDAREVVTRATGFNPEIFPECPTASLEQVLDKDWFPCP